MPGLSRWTRDERRGPAAAQPTYRTRRAHQPSRANHIFPTLGTSRRGCTNCVAARYLGSARTAASTTSPGAGLHASLHCRHKVGRWANVIVALRLSTYISLRDRRKRRIGSTRHCGNRLRDTRIRAQRRLRRSTTLTQFRMRAADHLHEVGSQHRPAAVQRSVVDLQILQRPIGTHPHRHRRTARGAGRGGQCGNELVELPGQRIDVRTCPSTGCRIHSPPHLTPTWPSYHSRSSAGAGCIGGIHVRRYSIGAGVRVDDGRHRRRGR